jgi:hypothetical protein
MVRIPRTRDAPLGRPRDPGELPIGVVWSLYGRPSDLVLVDRYARRLGITVSWRRMVAGRRHGSQDLQGIDQETD